LVPLALIPAGSAALAEDTQASAAETPAVRFEMRLGAMKPVAGWTVHTVEPDSRPVYVSPHVELDNADVASAWHQPAGEAHHVGLLLTEEGALKLARLTKRHLGAHVALLVDGRLVAAPRIAAEITQGRAVINGAFAEPEARDVAAGIVGP
jgi:preprotein translocase subunit SecD